MTTTSVRINPSQPSKPSSESTPSARPSALNPPTNARQRETVLVVDDEALVRQVIVLMLRRFGYRVLEAHGSLEAQRLAGNEHVQLLVADFSMPELNGLELARWFQVNHPGTRILIATGSLWECMSQLGDHEDFAILAKPFDGAQLGRMVRLVLDEGAMMHRHLQAQETATQALPRI